MDIIRITAHPASAEVIVLSVPYQHNQKMAFFEGAQFDPEHRGYIVHVDLLDALDRFARVYGFYLLDLRPAPADHPTVRELCDRCGKPEDQCQTAAGNSGQFRDHGFVTPAMGELQRRARRRE